MEMEGDCKSTHTLGDAKLCRNILISTDVRTSEFRTVTEPSPSSSSTEDGFASTSGCKPSASNGVSVRIDRMMQWKTEYSSAVEFEIEASKVQ